MHYIHIAFILFLLWFLFSYLVHYPVIPVTYSAGYYVPAYAGYYVPYVPTNTYSDIYGVPHYETTWMPSLVEPNSITNEEENYDLYTPENG